MLPRIWGDWIPHTLLVGLQSIDTLENNLTAS